MFSGSADILTRQVQLDGVTYRIVGVMKPAFAYPQFSDLPYGTASIKATQIWLPLTLTPRQKTNREPDDNNTIARLRPGVSTAQAQAEMSANMSRLNKLHAGIFRDSGALIESFMDTAIGSVQRLMWILFGAVSIVLIIACANASSLLLARATNRTRELSVRAALGAGRGRIVRQLLTESLLLSAAAGVLGIGLAWLFLRALPLLDPGNIPRLNTASLDLRVLAFTLIITLATSVLTGTLPAITLSNTSLSNFLSSGSSRNATGSHSRTQSALIIAETALVVVLLSCAGLLLRSYINVQSVDTGFSPGTVTMTLWPEAQYRYQQADRSSYFRPLIDKVRALPGVTAAGSVSNLPLSNSESMGFFQVEGYPNQDGQLVEGRSVTPEYFSAMSIALVALLLAPVGIYGLMAYSVTRRTQEMGIRMALGAQRNDVVMLILRNAASLLSIGLFTGLACAWAATHAIRSFLFGLDEHDPITVIAVCAILATGGFIAAYLPARRASSIDPMAALRAE